MDTLRLVLIIIGVLILGAIYLYSTRRRDAASRDPISYDPRDVTNNDGYKFDHTPVNIPSADAGTARHSEPDNLSEQLSQLGGMISQYKSKPAERVQTSQHRPAIRKDASAAEAGERKSSILEPSIEADNSFSGEPLPETPPVKNQSQFQISDPTPANSEVLRQSVIDGVAGFPQIIVLNIVARHGVSFRGTEMLNAVHAAGMEFGDMGIFHHFNSDNGRRCPIFSLANMLEPGSFDFEDMAAFSTAGLTLFMQLPAPVDSLMAYEDMLTTAQAIATSINGDVCDERRNLVTLQAIEHTREQLREFNYKLMVARKRAEQH
jgi:cell division protein ZipA